MFAGHLGAGLLLKRLEPKVGLGSLFLAAMLLDAVLWLLLPLGLESLRLPADFARMSDLQFDFPYSHSLLASVLWSVAAALVWRMALWRHASTPRGTAVIGLAVFSHFILDWLVHSPEIPVAGRNSPLPGLGLWKSSLPLAWCIESTLALAGAAAYLRATSLPKRRQAVLIIGMIALTTLTVLGQASHSPPPSASIMASTSLMTIVLVTLFAWWVDRRPAS